MVNVVHTWDIKIQRYLTLIFDGLQIRTMLKDEAFVATMNNDEKTAWLSFKKVVENFLGNHKSDNYAELVADLLRNYKKLSYLMNYKLLSPFASRLLSTKSWRLQRRAKRTISRYQRNGTLLPG